MGSCWPCESEDRWGEEEGGCQTCGGATRESRARSAWTLARCGELGLRIAPPEPAPDKGARGSRAHPHLDKAPQQIQRVAGEPFHQEPNR